MWIFGYGSLVWKVDFPYVKKVIGYIKGYERKFWQASIDHRGVPEKPGRVVTLVPSIDPQAKVWGAAYKIHRADINRVIQHLDLREVMGYEKVPVEFYPVPNHSQNVLEPASPLDYNNVTKNAKQNLEKHLNTNTKAWNNLNAAITSSDDRQDVVPSYDGQQSSESESDLEVSDNESHASDIQNGSRFTVMMYYGSSENEHYIGPSSLESMARQIFECIGPSGKNKEYLYNLAKAMRQICEEAVDSDLAKLEEAVRNMEIQYNLRKPGTPIEL